MTSYWANNVIPLTQHNTTTSTLTVLLRWQELQGFSWPRGWDGCSCTSERTDHSHGDLSLSFDEEWTGSGESWRRWQDGVDTHQRHLGSLQRLHSGWILHTTQRIFQRLDSVSREWRAVFQQGELQQTLLCEKGMNIVYKCKKYFAHSIAVTFTIVISYLLPQWPSIIMC